MWIRSALLLVVAALLSSCAATPKNARAEYAVVRTFFATDRHPIPGAEPAERFGAERSERVHYGTVDVSIPRDHRMGELESPSVLRLEFKGDPNKHVLVLDTSTYAKDSLFRQISDKVRQSDKRSALIFVHGYNVSFADAARRTAQISYDLGFAGAPVFYSWPSKAQFLAYPRDEENVRWSEANLKVFLKDFLAHSAADHIYLIAHSMGNRALTGALTSLLREAPAEAHRFKQIVLTAPDIDADIFKRDIAPALAASGKPVTLYASSKDLALFASKRFHGYKRAGDSGQDIVIAPGMETIDATDLDTGFLGHSYYAESGSVISDLFYLIRDGKKADERFGLARVQAGASHYWRFKK